MNLSQMFPPLYQCSKCGAAVKITPQGLGVEPLKEFSCPHTDAIIWAHRKTTLHGEGGLSHVQKITLTLRQILSRLTNRSI